MKEPEQQVTSNTPLINDGQRLSLGPLSCFISEVNKERMKTAGFMLGASAAGAIIPFAAVEIGSKILPYYGEINELYEVTGIVAAITTPVFGAMAGLFRCLQRSQEARSLAEAPSLA